MPYFRARWPAMSATIAPTTVHQLPDDCWAISPGLLRSTTAPWLQRRAPAWCDCYRVGRLLGLGSFVVFQPLHKALELHSGHLLPKVRGHQHRGKALSDHRIRIQNRLPNIGIIMPRPNIPEAGTDQRSRLIEFMAGDAGELSDELFRRPIGGGRHHRLGGRCAWLRRCLGAREGRHHFGGDGDLPTLDALQEG